jgi:hypothetical protein
MSNLEGLNGVYRMNNVNAYNTSYVASNGAFVSNTVTPRNSGLERQNALPTNLKNITNSSQISTYSVGNCPTFYTTSKK